MSKIAAIIGRLLIAVIFIVSGLGKLTDPASTAQSLSSVGLSSALAIPTGIFELVAGLMLAAGFAVRLVSMALFVFVALATLFFHNHFTDPMQAAMAMKNLAIMGGLMLAFAHSQMWSHYYAMGRQRKVEIAAHDAEKRAHEAELRAARAEAAMEARDTARVPVDRDGDGYADGYAVTRRRRWFDW
ncbi:MAG: DoxX family protein [Novosphingobium sp.]|nr:DoxX family protein [Novosphingobium sp.]